MNVIIVFADSELELAPEGAHGHAACSLPVLDAFFHRELMNGLPEGSRRGRPDIVHSSLLLCQGSALFRKALLRVYVHTRHDQVIAIHPDADVAPNYIKFLLDMGALLNGERVPGYTLSDRTFSELISDLAPDTVLALTPEGREIPLKEYFHDFQGQALLVVIGGFPEGDYSSPVYELADDQISLGPELMRVPDVVTTVLHALPRAAQR